MSQKCLKKYERTWISDKGSVQVIEISYILPIVFLTVLAVMYIMFVLLVYVNAYNATKEATNMAVKYAGEDRVYWQISGHSLSSARTDEIIKYVEKSADTISFVPGMSAEASFSELKNGSRARAEVSASLLGKELFRVASEVQLLKPTEYAQNVDLAVNIVNESELIDYLKEKYSQFVSEET